MKVFLMTLAILLPLAASTYLPGGKINIHVDLNDPKVVFAVQAINSYLHSRNPNDKQQHTCLEVIGAKSQVVAGTMYYLKLKMSAKPKDQTCIVKVWERVWLNPALKTENIECNDEDKYSGDYKTYKPRKGQLLGGQVPVNFTNRIVQEALKPVTDRVNSLSTSKYRLIPSGNGIFTEQVVNGIIYRFTDMEMVVTKCEKSDQKYTLQRCPRKQSQDSVVRAVDALVFWNFKDFKLENFEFCLISDSFKKTATKVIG